jgi:hypothetical protein
LDLSKSHYSSVNNLKHCEDKYRLKKEKFSYTFTFLAMRT